MGEFTGDDWMSDILQVAGALMVLGAYALAQFRVIGQHTYPYLALNILGSGILAILAAISLQWGFLLLEGGWALVSLWGLIGRVRGRAPAAMRGASS